MANEQPQTEAKLVALHYCLTFKNRIKKPAVDLPTLILQNNGKAVELTEGDKTFSLMLRGVKVNKKIYQPVEIEAEMDFLQVTTDDSNQPVTKVPSFKSVSALLLQRQVELKITHEEKSFIIAKNCYVFEVNPQLKRDANGTKMYMKLNIFSMDKLMTLNKYSKAYVARKLGSGIIKPESLKFGLKADGQSPLVESDITNLIHLKYDEKLTDDGKTTIPSEFIQPYLVQYNESFYDFLVRTANRCGEFLYFEDGRLTLGLPKTKDKTEPVTIKDFESVVIQNIDADPLKIENYVRDSIKTGNEVGELNHTVIEKEDTGFPEDIFPDEISSNAELSSDEYMFPLVEDKFTKMTREAIYDQPINKVMNGLKTVTMGNGIVPSVVSVGVAEGLLAGKAAFQVSTTNTAMQKNNITPYSKRLEQSKDGKVVQFATLDPAGWTTINYYNDIHKYESEQQRQIICINMGTNFVPLILGQKIKVEGLDDNFIVIQIQMTAEQAWTVNYDKYGQTVDDLYAGTRQQKIYAIPTYVDKDSIERYYPPVHPVPIIRKAGPQAAFVTDNNDPKYQGRVRVAYPWQSLAEVMTPLKDQLKETNLKLASATINKFTSQTKAKQLKGDIIMYSFAAKDVADYLEGSNEKRESMISKLKKEIEKLEKEIKELKDKKKSWEEHEVTSVWLIEYLDEYIKDSSLDDIKKELKEKEEKLISPKTKLAYILAAAEDEKKNKDNKDYNIENNAAIKELDEKVKNLKAEFRPAEKELKEATKEVDDLTNRKEVIEAKIQGGAKEISTPWIRVATPMATPGGGTYFKPQIGDEVLVNYDNDNVERPYVVGSLFSKNNLDPAERIERKGAPAMQFGSGKQVSMSIMSPNGHHITFSDPKDGNKFIYGLNPGMQFWGPFLPLPSIPNSKELAGGIHIGDRYGIYEIEMSSHDRYVNIKSPLGSVNIDAFTGITINAPNGDVRIVGKNVSIEAGNQVSITSGNNIMPAGIGDPDYRCGTPIWHSLKEAGWWAPLTFFENLGRGIRYGVLFLGHQVAAAAPAIVNDMLGPAAFADLSLLRHMFELAVKPVDGTMLIKSKRYLKLEAGNGMAKIKADRMTTKNEIHSVEMFFVALIYGITKLNDRIDEFFDSYRHLKESAIGQKLGYDMVAEAFLKDAKDPDVKKIALEATSDEWDQSIIDDIDCTGKMKDEDVEYRGETYRGDDKVKQFKSLATPFGQAVHGLYKIAADVMDLFEDYDDDKPFEKAAKDAFQKIMDPHLKEWKDQFWDVTDPTDQLLSEKADPFSKEVTKTLIKRKATAMYLIKIKDSRANDDGKFLYLGFKESDVTDEKVKSDYNWKNFMTHFDHGSTFGNKAMIYLLDGLWEPMKKRFGNPFGALKEKDIWRAGKGGQILFSDNDGATLHFEGEGLKSESQSNLGNRDQLVKLLLSIK